MKLGKTDIRYSAEAHIYWSAQISVFSHIILNVDVSTFCSFKSSIKRLLCAVVVAASCLLSYENGIVFIVVDEERQGVSLV